MPESLQGRTEQVGTPRSQPVPCSKCGQDNWSGQSAVCVCCRGAGEMSAGNGPASAPPLCPPTEIAPPGAPATTAERLAHDLICMRCQYNLRSLRPDDRCPECGEMVERSLCVQDLTLGDPRWRQSIANGGRTLLIGLVLLLTALPLAYIIANIVGLLALLVAAITIPIGVFNLTESQRLYPGREVAGVNEVARRWSRRTAPAVPLTLLFPMALAFISSSSLRIDVPVLFVLIGALAGGTGACVASTMLLLSSYATILHRGALSKQCKVIAGVYAAILGSVAICAVLPFVVPGSVAAAALAVPLFGLSLVYPVTIWMAVIVGTIAGQLAQAAGGAMPR